MLTEDPLIRYFAFALEEMPTIDENEFTSTLEVVPALIAGMQFADKRIAHYSMVMMASNYLSQSGTLQIASHNQIINCVVSQKGYI